MNTYTHHRSKWTLKHLLLITFALSSMVVASTAAALEIISTSKANIRPASQIVEREYIFTAPPRETEKKGKETYGPIAAYLTKVTGKKFVYKHPGSWINYQSNMQKNKYDLVFDGPHFVSWRIAKAKHTPLVKIPGDFIFVFLTQKDNKKVTGLEKLAGRSVCGHAPPNQGTLRLYNAFPNPSRQPVLKPVKGWRNIYKAMIAGKCDGAVVPLKIYKKLDPNGTAARVLLITDAAPGQAFTASSEIPSDVRLKITEMLINPKGQIATQKLRTRFRAKTLVKATPQEYADVKVLLKDSWGF